jgi:hypothetical protein
MEVETDDGTEREKVLVARNATVMSYKAPKPGKFKRDGKTWYSCPKDGCGHQVARLPDYNKHYRGRHDSTRLFGCRRGKCSKMFKDSTTRCRHERTHDANSFECAHCARSYTRKDNLNMHIRKLHPKATIEGGSSLDSSSSTRKPNRRAAKSQSAASEAGATRAPSARAARMHEAASAARVVPDYHNKEEEQEEQEQEEEEEEEEEEEDSMSSASDDEDAASAAELGGEDGTGEDPHQTQKSLLHARHEHHKRQQQHCDPVATARVRAMQSLRYRDQMRVKMATAAKQQNPFMPRPVLSAGAWVVPSPPLKVMAGSPLSAISTKAFGDLGGKSLYNSVEWGYVEQFSPEHQLPVGALEFGCLFEDVSTVPMDVAAHSSATSSALPQDFGFVDAVRGDRCGPRDAMAAVKVAAVATFDLSMAGYTSFPQFFADSDCDQSDGSSIAGVPDIV